MNSMTTFKLWFPYAFLLCLLVQVDAANLDQCSAKIANKPGQSNPQNMTYTQCVGALSHMRITSWIFETITNIPAPELGWKTED